MKLYIINLTFPLTKLHSASAGTGIIGLNQNEPAADYVEF